MAEKLNLFKDDISKLLLRWVPVCDLSSTRFTHNEVRRNNDFSDWLALFHLIERHTQSKIKEGLLTPLIAFNLERFRPRFRLLQVCTAWRWPVGSCLQLGLLCFQKDQIDKLNPLKVFGCYIKCSATGLVPLHYLKCASTENMQPTSANSRPWKVQI